MHSSGLSPQQIFTHQFDNGLTLIADSMPWRESVSLAMALPAGYRYDPPAKQGLANLVSEMVQRGCGDYNSRQFMETQERHGIDLGIRVSNYYSLVSATMQHQRLQPCLDLLGDVVRRPRLEQEQFADARLTCLQDVRAMEDDLNQKVMLELNQLFYGQPDGNCSEGTLETVEGIQYQDVLDFYQTHYSPQQTLISVAGKFDWDLLRDQVEELLADWQGLAPGPVEIVPPQHGYRHLSLSSEQTHIGIAYPGPSFTDPDYYLNRGAVGVLSGGMSSRLFYEVREKRGLCYSVSASSHSLKDRGSVMVYSGTSNQRAQETLDVILQQIQHLQQGISADELRRLKIQLRTVLVGEQESSRARARGLAFDWFYLGHLRTLSQIQQVIEDLTVERINQFLEQNPPPFFDIVTLGEQPLVVPPSTI